MRPSSAFCTRSIDVISKRYSRKSTAAWNRDLYDSFAKLELEISEYREAGDTVVGTGQIQTRGKESGAEVVSPFGVRMEFERAKATEIP